MPDSHLLGKSLKTSQIKQNFNYEVPTRYFGLTEGLGREQGCSIPKLPCDQSARKLSQGPYHNSI